MQDIAERIRHAVDVFRQTGRCNLVIGLTHADWDEFCAVLIDKMGASHADPVLTKNDYDGVPILSLGERQKSFVGHDYGSTSERRFPLETLQPLEAEPA